MLQHSTKLVSVKQWAALIKWENLEDFIVHFLILIFILLIFAKSDSQLHNVLMQDKVAPAVMAKTLVYH